jgi:multidrug efflux pump
MALNVEFDFLLREIVVGGLAGSWFIHLSAALVSGLFFSTALTLVMVPVMIVAPKVAGHQFARFFLGLWHLPGRILGLVFRRRATAVTPSGEVVEVPEDAPTRAPATVPPPKPANDEDSNRQAAE